MSVKKECRVLYRLVLAVFLLQGAFAVGAWAQEEGCGGGDRVRSVIVWGSPATAFSREPTTTLEELKVKFEALRADYEVVLRQAGWEGDPEDLFAAVRNAQEGSGAVTFRSAPQGTKFEWMAYRRRGKPACVKDIVWVALDPFPAWQIVVESRGVEYTFVAPQACLNLGLEGAREVPPPTCHLNASFDPETDTITGTGSSDASDFRIIAVDGPGASLQKLQSAGSGRWTLRPIADGTFRFSARATAASGRQSECGATVNVVRKKPELQLTAIAAPDTNLITIDANGSIGEVVLTGLTLPDGSSGDLGAIQPTTDPLKWTYDPSDSLGRKAGDYPYTFAGVARLFGQEDTGQASVSINVLERRGRWILRGFLATVDASDDFRTEGSNPSGLGERTNLLLGSGSGFGFALEYLINDRLGVEGTLLLADLDSDFIFDLGQDWGMDEDELGFTPLSVGLNYHLTPDRRADLYIGPFVALVQYDDVDFNALGQQFNREFDDEFTFGVNVGLDVPFGSETPWAFAGSLKYLAATAEGDNFDGELDVDPLIVTAGIAYRFK